MLDRISSVGSSAQQVKTSSTPEANKESLEKVFHSQSELIEKKLNSNEKEKVAKVVDSLNEFLSPTHTSLKFEYHDKLNEYYVTLVNDTTNEIVKEIPSKKMLDFYAAMEEFIGIMVDRKI